MVSLFSGDILRAVSSGIVVAVLCCGTILAVLHLFCGWLPCAGSTPAWYRFVVLVYIH